MSRFTFPSLPALRARTGPRTEELARIRLRDTGTDGNDALQIPARRAPDKVSTSICGFCSTGCSLDVHVRDKVPVNVVPTRGYPVNDGSACPKGWEAMTPMSSAGRGTQPLLRRKGHLEPVSWSSAFDAFCAGVRKVQAEHGPDSVAFLSTGQIVTEEMALLGSLAKFGLGMVHGDGNTRQCMATAVTAYKESFGFDAPPYTYDDFEQSDVVVLVGSNLAVAHPIMFERLQRNPHSPEIIVVDPRTTETAMAATQHLSTAPKSDQALFYGIARELIARCALDRVFIEAHTSGFDEFAAFVDDYRVDVVCEATGLSPEAFLRAVEAIAEGERVSFWWTMGVNQGHAATRTAQAIIAVALMTGNIGRPGTGANSITGQCNAMGSRLFSNTASLLGGRDTTNPAHRQEVADVLDIDVAAIPDRPSMAYDQIIEGIVRGDIRGLWIIATNPAHSWINQGHLTEMLDRLDFLVVQDLYPDTETATHADLYLPAAGWAEKEGTFINSERRIARVRPAHRPPGEARSDFDIFKGIAEAWGCGPMFRRWRNPEAVFGLLTKLSEGRPCDFTGIEGYADLDDGGVQWPWPADAAVPTTTTSRPTTTTTVLAGESRHLRRSTPASSENLAVDRVKPERQRRLFADGRFFHPDGRAKFIAETPTAPPERVSDRFPLLLLTGRGSTAQWHTQTRTARSPVLATLSPDRLYVEVAPVDADARQLRSGDLVLVKSRRGEIQATVFVTPTIRTGQVFLPMHESTVNIVTAPGFDPYSRQPSYKHSAVELVAVNHN